MVSTLDFESSDPSSNLGRTFLFVFHHFPLHFHASLHSVLKFKFWCPVWDAKAVCFFLSLPLFLLCLFLRSPRVYVVTGRGTSRRKGRKSAATNGQISQLIRRVSTVNVLSWIPRRLIDIGYVNCFCFIFIFQFWFVGRLQGFWQWRIMLGW